MQLLIVGVGTLHDIQEGVWFPASPLVWREAVLFSPERTARPNIVADLRSCVDLGLPQGRFDAILSVFGPRAHLVGADGSISREACINMCDMLQFGGVLACPFDGTPSERDRLCRQIACVEPRLVCGEGQRRQVAKRYADAFFLASERGSVRQRFADDPDLLLLRRRTS